MAATLTADPNPVGIWAPPGPGTVHIKWDTDSNNRGKVYLRVDGVDAGQVAGGGNGTVTGEFDYADVWLDKTYVFTLRRASNNALLATLTVKAYDLQKELLDLTVGAILFSNQLDPPQAIYGLYVEPGVDTVRILFRTRRPTVPHVTISTLDGEQVVSWVPFFGGLRTRHVLEYGHHSPLAQGTWHRVRISVPGSKPPVSLDPDPPKNIVRTAEFQTGTRTVDVWFDFVKVLRDGDPVVEGASDFEFKFAAGDASNPAATIVEFGPFKRDIDQDDPPVKVNWFIPLFDGPRDVWVGVAGIEWDGNLYMGLDVWGVSSGFVGSRPIDRGNFEGSEVGRIFDLSGAGLGPTTTPFELQTGDFGVAFIVFGRIKTFVRPGVGWFTIPVDHRPARFKMAVLRNPGAKGTMSGKHGAGTLVALDAEGRVWQRSIEPERPSPHHEGWSPLAPAPGGAVTGLRHDDGRIELFGLAADGVAQRWLPGEAGRDGRWGSLGGTFKGALVAVEQPDGRTALFGLDADGRVRRRTLGTGADEHDEWEDLGGAIAGNLLAIDLPEDGPALLAIDREGRVVHRMARRGGDQDWRPLGGPRAGWLVAQPADDGGILVVVLTEAGVLHRLRWRDRPQGEPERAWEELGTLETLMPLQPLPTPQVREPEDGTEAAAAAA